jgi:hypothetical protein
MTNWIEALAAVVAASAAVGVMRLTYLSLVVLKAYAADTKKIAEASVSQREDSQMPFLTTLRVKSVRQNGESTITASALLSTSPTADTTKVKS